MASRTYHVFRADGSWTVKKAGATRQKTFRTQDEAIRAARTIAKKNTGGGQLVVHGRDGRILKYETYGMTRVQDPPKKSPLAERIGRAVAKVALLPLESDSHGSSALPLKK